MAATWCRRLGDEVAALVYGYFALGRSAAASWACRGTGTAVQPIKLWPPVPVDVAQGQRARAGREIFGAGVGSAPMQ